MANDQQLKDVDDLGTSPIANSGGAKNANGQSKADKLNAGIDAGVGAMGGASGGAGGGLGSATGGPKGMQGMGGMPKGGAPGGQLGSAKGGPKGAEGLSGKHGGAQSAMDKYDKYSSKKDSGGSNESEADKYAKAAGKTAGAAAGAYLGGSEGAQVGAKVGEEATKNGRWKFVAAAIIAPTVIAIAIPVFIIAYIINNPWDAIRQVLTGGPVRTFGLGVARAFANNAVRTAVEALTYTGEVEYHGPNTAIAANPATPITPGSTLDKLSKIDWKKAQYQTLDNSDCGYELKLKQVVNAQGQTRFVPDSVINKRTRAVIPLNQLSSNISAAYCIQEQYPIFNLMARQPVTRDINDQADVHLNYASKKDTEELRGNYQEVNKYVYDKTLDRITPDKSKTIDFSLYAGQLRTLTNSYKQAVLTWNAQNPDQQIEFDDSKANISDGINKMFDDMSGGKSPYSIQVGDYLNIPTRDGIQNRQISEPGIAYSMCPFVMGFLNSGPGELGEKAAQNMRNAVESRLNSTERGSIKVNTLADTRKADQLSNVENNNTIRQQDNWASSTAYQLDVYDELRGVGQNPEATSTRAYNASITDLNNTVEINLIKIGCTFLTVDSDSAAVQRAFQGAGSDIVFTGYRILKEKILAQSNGYFNNLSDFGLEQIITAFVRTGSATAVSGLEEGPSNYNRQAAGFKQLMNDYYLRIGGRFLTEEEARQVAIDSNNIRIEKEKQGGIAYRLFSPNNTRSARSIITHNTITPKTTATASIGIFKQLLDPIRSLASIDSSIKYYATGTRNTAFAANTTSDKYLKIDTSGIPEQDFNIDMLENARIIEDLKANGSADQKNKFTNYDACFKAKVPTQDYFSIKEGSYDVTPNDGNNNPVKFRYFEFFPERRIKIDANGNPLADQGDNAAKAAEYFKFFDCKVILQDAKDFNDPNYQIPIRYRMYTYYNTILDQMDALSSDDDNQSIYAGAGQTAGVSTGPVDGGADTSSIPCPTEPGITDGPIEQTYGPGRVAQNKIHICDVQGIQVNVSIASNVNRLLNDIKAAGIAIGGSSFRSYDRQKQLRIAHGCADDSLSSSACSPPTAPPGRSLHEKGLAIDFTDGSNTIRSGSAQFNWLVANAANYGLQNLPSEPWHWSINGS